MNTTPERLPIIFLADDSKTQRLAITQALEGGHQTIVEFENGDDLWQRLRAEKPDLILLDVVMPGTNGYTLCRRIKRDPGLSGIPVVMVTSRDQAADVTWGMRQGADAYLSKPVDPEALRARVDELLRARGATQ